MIEPGRTYDETGVCYDALEFPGVEFVELKTDGGVMLLVRGSTREARDSARDRFRAAMVEFGCRFDDIEFVDEDQMEQVAAGSTATGHTFSVN